MRGWQGSQLHALLCQAPLLWNVSPGGLLRS